MFEESFKMPFIIRWPGVVKPGSKPSELIQNIDDAPTFLDAAGLKIPNEVQGKSLLPVLKGESTSWRDSLYYAYYEIGEHAVPQHFGVRTLTHKLFYLPQTDEWQLFDLTNDPNEMKSVFDAPGYSAVQKELRMEYERLREAFDAPPYDQHLQSR